MGSSRSQVAHEGSSVMMCTEGLTPPLLTSNPNIIASATSNFRPMAAAANEPVSDVATLDMALMNDAQSRMRANVLIN